jgi:DMSO/TMAO reductase YedYZ molybdopterin-dependent catalytic subunit
LPPGQHEIASFPRYGGHFARPDPPVPHRPLIKVERVGIEAIELDAAALQNLPRVSLVADFHCVAGWTTCGLHWEGVRFRDIYETLVKHEAGDATVSHIRAVGRDGWRAVLLLEDALADDVLIADRLDGEPLPVEHGGPFRLVSASQYGYKSVKHLSRIELHDDEPSDAPERLMARLGLKAIGMMHPRARVDHEERTWTQTTRAVLWIGRVVHPTGYVLGYLGALRTRRQRRM